MRKHWLFVIVIVVAVALSVWAFPQLPEQMPSHWNFKGEVDDYSSKWFGVLFAPLLMTVLYWLMPLTMRLDPKQRNNGAVVQMMQLIANFFLLFFFGLHVVVIAAGLGYDVDISLVVPLAVGGLFIALGNVMPRVKQNYFLGVRTPWALEDAQVWAKTQRIGGYTFVAGGIVLIVTAFMHRWRN